ncbi:SH3 domain-containing protein [Victivallis sp. Marseille-Q1083]|uniref:SH3 domain-containing protein n=1 Tax=Victivallis sp. Marseille-Q1083 TaxID=2717288 RepID=UPI001589E770|nr:SH3 domain-containing protein [Victivallis sp. Marseille-Q1083]
MLFRALFSTLLLFGMAVDAAPGLPAATAGKVNATTLNVRVKPQGNASTVARLKNGDPVQVVGASGDWYEILVPASCQVYLAAQFVKDGKTTREVNMRSGAGVEFQSYGLLPAGSTVKVLGTNERKDWVKIAPPAGLTAFVSKKYIELAPNAAGTPPEKTVPPAETGNGESESPPPQQQPEKTPPAGRIVDQPDQTVAKPPEIPAGPPQLTPEEREKKFLNMRFIADSAKEVKMVGVVRDLTSSDLAVSHALVERGDAVVTPTLGYLYCRNQNLADFLNKTVKIEGTRHLVEGWKAPVIEIATITVVHD